MPSLVRPEFGPTLPALLRERAGVPPRATIAGVVVLVVLAGIVAVLVRPGTPGDTQLVHEGEPVFNMLYTADQLDRAEPRAGELVRFEGERGDQRVEVTVRPLELPPFEGDVSHALLPTFATRHEQRLSEEYDGFTLTEEGRARVGGSPGYEVSFQAGPESERTFGSDVMVVPGEDDASGAVLISFRRVAGSAIGKDERELVNAARSTFRSFVYGRDRP